MTFLLSNGRKRLLPDAEQETPYKNLPQSLMQKRTRLTQMSGEQMQKAGQVGKAEHRQLLYQIDRSSKKVPSGKRNHHGAEDP
jgi:hypothetical protein